MGEDYLQEMVSELYSESKERIQHGTDDKVNLMTFLCAAVSIAAEFTETQSLKSGLVKFNGILCFLALLLLQE